MTPKPTGARASSPRSLRVLPASGAVMAAIAVALSAYVAHVVDPAAQARLQPAALFAFGHGIALAALGPLAVRWSGCHSSASSAASIPGSRASRGTSGSNHDARAARARSRRC